MKPFRLSILGLALACCTHAGDLTGPESPKQVFTSNKVDWYAGRLEVSVAAKFTKTRTTYGCNPGTQGCYDFAYYVNGVATFFIPAVEEADYPYLDAVAAHEVCHAIYPFHDSHHWCCQKKLGVEPTYPLEGVQGVVQCQNQ